MGFIWVCMSSDCVGGSPVCHLPGWAVESQGTSSTLFCCSGDSEEPSSSAGGADLEEALESHWDSLERNLLP